MERKKIAQHTFFNIYLYKVLLGKVDGHVLSVTVLFPISVAVYWYRYLFFSPHASRGQNSFLWKM